MSNGARRLALACVLCGAMLGAGATVSPVTAQQCHPSYGGCLPWYEGDALNCEDINWAVVEVWNVNDDPYNLDVLYGPGNGWTCDGVG